ncbi:hypothetical protein [Shinella sp. JR1-6]|uniref:hypothetical protein n=1 Tax=Shinella sp. JR1-6 TaxID=2527671 RepID=UPI00102D43A2|nr:hypothetical protein [Shinella sp. JR1-6]TAA54024.1 hypothetical protein EXZ48_27300 [Shinella sp. JR1-6]
MSNVVSLGKREPLVWMCASCGCTTFRLYEGGMTECASCEVQGADNGEWINELPEPTGPIKDVLPDSKVISFGDASPSVALRSMLKRVDADNLVAIIAFESNGRVRTWGGIDTLERVEWLDRRLSEARELLTMLAPKDGV